MKFKHPCSKIVITFSFFFGLSCTHVSKVDSIDISNDVSIFSAFNLNNVLPPLLIQ